MIMRLRKVKTNDGFQPARLHEGYQPFLQHGYQPVIKNDKQIAAGSVSNVHRITPPKTASNVIMPKRK